MSLRFVFVPVSLLALAGAAQAQVPTTNFSDFSRADVVDASGAAIGALRDVVVDGGGRIEAILIGQGGVLGIGETLKLMPTDTLPAIVDGKIRLDGQTTDTIAALKDYSAAETEKQAEGSPPVSGANQTAPQSASANVPVAPAQVDAKADTSLPPTPENDAAAGKAAADSSRAPAASPTLGEETAQGSGSGGMAPQQGTGTGSTQAAPAANENAQAQEGNAAGSDPQLNQQYGRDMQPDSNKTEDSSSGRAATDAQSAGQPASDTGTAAPPAPAAPAPASSVPAAPDMAASDTSTSWRIGKIVGAPVIGDRDGLEVKDVRLGAGGAEDVVLSQTGQPDTTVAFSGLNLGGTADEPTVALTLQPSTPAPEPVRP